MTKNLIILAAGASSRMKTSDAKDLSEADVAQSNAKSKGLIKIVKGRPFLDYLILHASEAGFRNIYFVISPDSDEFKELYGPRKIEKFSGLTFKFATQHIPGGRRKPLGTADAVLQTLEQFPNLKSEEFVVCNSDNLYSIEVLKILSETQFENALIAYGQSSLGLSDQKISNFAILDIENGKLNNIIEKPDVHEFSMFRGEDGEIRVSMNIFKFTGTQIYPFLKNCPINPHRNEKELPTAIFNMIKSSDATMAAIPVEEEVPDLTSKQDILTVRSYLLKNYGKIKW